MTKSQKEIIGIITSVVIIGFMVMIAELINSKEVIFPEISAICLGSFISPKFAWNTSKPRMLLCITICAVCGYCISTFFPMYHDDYGIKLLLAFIIGNFVLMFSKTGFVPMISAVMLPVVVGTDSIIYPISACILILLVVLLSVWFEKLGIKEKPKYIPKKIHLLKDGFAFLKRLMIYLILLSISWKTDFTLALAPPLLVAFTELSNPKSSARKRPVTVCFLMFVSAFIGEITEFILCTLYGLPMFIGVMVAVSMVIVILRYFEIYMPPMLAITTLAFLFNAHYVLYTLKITIGFSILMLCALLFFKREEYQWYH